MIQRNVQADAPVGALGVGSCSGERQDVHTGRLLSLEGLVFLVFLLLLLLGLLVMDWVRAGC